MDTASKGNQQNSASNEQKRIERYDQAGRNRALLRWSLWIANNGRCYLCAEVTEFVHTQIDHIVPEHLPAADFTERWKSVAGDLPDKGAQHISNLRACCADCNSARVKGRHVLPDVQLSAVLAHSARIMALAFTEQARMRRGRAVGESIVKITAAETNDDYRILWEQNLNQALMSTLRQSAQVVTLNTAKTIIYDAERGVPFTAKSMMTADTARLIAAVHLTSGVPISSIIVELITNAKEAFSGVYQTFAESLYEDFRGANAGDTDWTNASFTINWEQVTIHNDECRVTADVTVDTIVSSQLSLQSLDGERLEETVGPDCRIMGPARFELTIQGELGITVVDLVSMREEIEEV